jgi:hypothetical protein
MKALGNINYSFYIALNKKRNNRQEEYNRKAIDLFWPVRACRAIACAAAGRPAKRLVWVCVGLWLINQTISVSSQQDQKSTRKRPKGGKITFHH